MEERKDWGRMERMAGRIQRDVGSVAEILGETVEWMRGRDLSSDELTRSNLEEQGGAHDKMAQAGMIFIAAGSHLVGMAESKRSDLNRSFHCAVRKHFVDPEGWGRCPICGNPRGAGV